MHFYEGVRPVKGKSDWILVWQQLENEFMAYNALMRGHFHMVNNVPMFCVRICW